MSVHETDQYTKLLLHCDGLDGSTVFTDSSGLNHSIVGLDTTRISTSKSRYGGSSVFFDGRIQSGLFSGSFDTIPISGNFTVDFWFYLRSYAPSVQNSHCLFNFSLGPNLFFSLGASQAGFYCYSGDWPPEQNTIQSTNPLNCWIHCALVRLGNYITIYKNGVKCSLYPFFRSYSALPENLNVRVGIGREIACNYTVFTCLDGYIDEFRLSSGIARWLDNFVLDPVTILPIPSLGGNLVTVPATSPITGAMSINYGGDAIVRAVPNGYAGSNVVTSIKVDGVHVSTYPTYKFSNVVENHTITAVFANSNVIYISASSGSGGTISPSGSLSCFYGSNKTFTFTPDFGYQINSVVIDGLNIGEVSSYTFSNILISHDISVTFKLANSYIITTSVSMGGTISPPGIINCSKGSNKVFIFTPNEFYQINDVLVDGVSVGKVSSYTFSNIQTAHTIAVVFSLITYQIISTAGLHGTITPLGTTVVNQGSSQGYVLTPDEDYVIHDVIVDGVVVELPASGTLFITD